ncbi:MerR family transcriptional regulator [Euzebya tangerina]|uniref:transcriptional regulator FtsR n=1 Tax=Euzebya tangerina TaxID=591198 RepID=UPI000E318267|nr:MerR family transcriptional regulator [Euzebya tangerina]
MPPSSVRGTADGPQGFTIGEVLNQLKEDFEDITISKIRFLESEGLIYPDRTESGYRIFSEDDVDRLRFILTAQRDHYLPLKVIREQLDRLDAGEGLATGPGPAPPPALVSGTAEDDEELTPTQVALQMAKAVESAAAGTDAAVLDAPTAAVELTLREYCEATGLDSAQVRALREYAIVGDPDDETAPFDADDLLTGRAARELLALGLEPRHLRMYRQFVDREVALFEQLATPLLRQRNPEARRQAGRQLEKLSGLTSRLKRSLLSRELRRYVRGA